LSCEALSLATAKKRKRKKRATAREAAEVTRAKNW
jgi:hypothetical protein